MHNSIASIVDLGSRGILIEIECHLSNNLPAIVIVGSAGRAVDEAKERVRAAFLHSSLQLPRKRITINLAPADLPKTDSSFDLAIALSILLTGKQVPATASLSESVVIGELGLHGDVRPVRGIIGKLNTARALGRTTFIIPKANLAQAQLVPGVTLLAVQTIKQLYDYLTTGAGLTATETGNGIWGAQPAVDQEIDALSEIVGQAHAKRAVEIAAAGGHNLLLTGPPGTGKSMLAKALPSLLPPMDHDEVLEVTQLHSLARYDYDSPIMTRPLRAPHHSASLVALVGGGHSLRPGEISLAHRGVLFLDEVPEFSRSALEALRQPLEDRFISVSRAKDAVDYPANFILIATANPCPCGYYGSGKPCICLPHQIMQYQNRISGPIMDRIDLHSVVQDIKHRDLLQARPGGQADCTIRNRITQARKTEASRYDTASKLNADMTNQDIKRFARIETSAKTMLDMAAERLNISARSYMKTIKVARTIADLDSSTSIEQSHIAEALQFRRTEQVTPL